MENEEKKSELPPGGPEKSGDDDSDPTEFQKEASKIGIEWVKQLITLSLGAIAFIVGFGLSHATDVSRSFVFWSVSPFVVSAGAGLLFMMCFIGHVNEYKSYNVYDGLPKKVAFLQLLSFVAGLVLLGVFTFRALGQKSSSKSSAVGPLLEVTMGSNTIKHPIFSNGETSIRINAQTNLDVQIKPR